MECVFHVISVVFSIVGYRPYVFLYFCISNYLRKLSAHGSKWARNSVGSRMRSHPKIYSSYLAKRVVSSLGTRLGRSLGELENLAVEVKVVSTKNGSIFELL